MKRIAIAVCVGSTALTAVAGNWTVKDGDTPEIYYKGKLKTKVHADAGGKPALHPLIGPDEIYMTRAFPLEALREGEKKDHPHHTGLWFTHGSVNGKDFWQGGRNLIKTDSQKVVADETGATISVAKQVVPVIQPMCGIGLPVVEQTTDQQCPLVFA